MDYRLYSLRDQKIPLNRDRRRFGQRILHWVLAAALPLAALALLPLTSNDAKVLPARETSLKLPPPSAAAQPTAVEAAAVATGPSQTRPAAAAPETPSQATGVAVADPAAAPEAPRSGGSTNGHWKTVTVKSGDSLAKIFNQQNIDSAELHKVLQSGDLAKKLTRIQPGQSVQLLTDASGSHLKELKYDLDELNQLDVRSSGDGFDTELVVRVPDVRRTTVAAQIDNSLFESASKAGLPDKVTMELAEIFGWDIDFALDIREGDKFAVLYEEHYLDGKMIDSGRILAAEFVNQGASYKAVRFVDDQGNSDYYNPEGRSLRKAFIRTPVAFTRISSGFSLGRKHPILNTIRAHKGVDYAAPIGTPIKATGNGKIVWLGNKGGYGRCIVIQHGAKYSTLYGHMSRYKSGLAVGSRVRQGDVIGYVGMSGLATGPHLHYEFRVDGVHRNPLTVALPSADPLPARYMAEFKQVSETDLALLELAKTDAVALNR